MVKVYMRWKFNPRLIPVTIEERIRLWRRMHESIKTDLREHAVSAWGIYNEVSSGFSIVEGDEESVFESVKKWIPNVVFDIKPI
jgi:hypothetical protein